LARLRGMGGHWARRRAHIGIPERHGWAMGTPEGSYRHAGRGEKNPKLARRLK